MGYGIILGHWPSWYQRHTFAKFRIFYRRQEHCRLDDLALLSFQYIRNSFSIMSLSYQFIAQLQRATRSQLSQLRFASRRQRFSILSRTMAAQSTQASQVISETAQAEGGPTKGSTSAQMQSQVGKTQNFEQAAQEVGSKMQNNPRQVTSEVHITHKPQVLFQ